MIKVNVIKDGSMVKNININGHADYDEFGKDIVCAAVSSTVITTVNAILKIDEDAITYLQEDDKFIITVKKDNDVINLLISNMLSMLKELEEDYKKNITISEEE